MSPLFEGFCLQSPLFEGFCLQSPLRLEGFCLYSRVLVSIRGFLSPESTTISGMVHWYFSYPGVSGMLKVSPNISCAGLGHPPFWCARQWPGGVLRDRSIVFWDVLLIFCGSGWLNDMRKKNLLCSIATWIGGGVCLYIRGKRIFFSFVFGEMSNLRGLNPQSLSAVPKWGHKNSALRNPGDLWCISAHYFRQSRLRPILSSKISNDSVRRFHYSPSWMPRRCHLQVGVPNIFAKIKCVIKMSHKILMHIYAIRARKIYFLQIMAILLFFCSSKHARQDSPTKLTAKCKKMAALSFLKTISNMHDRDAIAVFLQTTDLCL